MRESAPSRRSWTLVFMQACLTMFFGFALRPLISAEILDGGHSSAWLGIATMVFAVPPLVLAIPAGRLLDRTGERPWLVGGSLIYLAATLLVMLAATISGDAALAMLLIASAVLGLGSLSTILGQQTWVMHGAAAGRPDYWFGLYTFALTVGQLVAPALLWLPGADEGSTLATRPITLALVGIAVVSTVLGAFVRSSRDRLPHGRPRSGGGRHGHPVEAPATGELDLAAIGRSALDGDHLGDHRDLNSYGDHKGHDDHDEPGERGGHTDARGGAADRRDVPEGMLRASFRLARRRGVVRALVASSLVLASIDIVIAYLPLLTNELGLDPAWIGALLMTRALAGMVSRLGLSRLTALLGRRVVMVSGAAIGAVALIVMALPAPPWALVACMVVYGFAAGTVQPLTMSWMTLITPASERGLVTSLRMVGNRVGQAVVPLVIAGVSVLGGGALAFAVTGATLALSALASTTAPNGDEVDDR